VRQAKVMSHALTHSPGVAACFAPAAIVVGGGVRARDLGERGRRGQERGRERKRER